MGKKSISIRIEEDVLHKLHIVSDYEARSVNSQILVLIRDVILQYEKDHGQIELGGKSGE